MYWRKHEIFAFDDRLFLPDIINCIIKISINESTTFARQSFWCIAGLYNSSYCRILEMLAGIMGIFHCSRLYLMYLCFGLFLIKIFWYTDNEKIPCLTKSIQISSFRRPKSTCSNKIQTIPRHFQNHFVSKSPLELQSSPLYIIMLWTTLAVFHNSIIIHLIKCLTVFLTC